MLDFQRTHFFFQKKALETCHPFTQPNCEKNKYFEPDHHISELMAHSKIANNDHQFSSRALSQKENNFSWIINQVLKIFWFQTLRNLDLKTKEIFE